jgi:hypothetical protein
MIAYYKDNDKKYKHRGGLVEKNGKELIADIDKEQYSRSHRV